MPLLAACLSAAAFRPVAVSQVAPKLIVIVHPTVTEKSLGIDDLRAIFLRKRLRWASGQDVVPINQATGSPARLAFDSTVLGFTADQVARYWIDQRIRSGLHAPRSIAGDAMVANVIKVLPGSIGYLPPGQANGSVHVVARIEGGRVLPP